MLILHGDHQTASRNQLLAVKAGAVQKDQQIIEFSGQDLSLDPLSQAADTVSLFGQTNSVFVQQLFSARPSNAKKAVIDYLKSHTSADIVVWEPKDVSAQLKDFPSSLIRQFDLPRHIFKFLDNPSLTTLHLALTTALPEIVFASLVTRAHKQVKTTWLEELLIIDYKLKTGALPYDLATALELWVANGLI